MIQGIPTQLTLGAPAEQAAAPKGTAPAAGGFAAFLKTAAGAEAATEAQPAAATNAASAVDEAMAAAQVILAEQAAPATGDTGEPLSEAGDGETTADEKADPAPEDAAAAAAAWLPQLLNAAPPQPAAPAEPAPTDGQTAALADAPKSVAAPTSVAAQAPAAAGLPAPANGAEVTDGAQVIGGAQETDGAQPAQAETAGTTAVQPAASQAAQQPAAASPAAGPAQTAGASRPAADFQATADFQAATNTPTVAVGADRPAAAKTAEQPADTLQAPTAAAQPAASKTAQGASAEGAAVSDAADPAQADARHARLDGLKGSGVQNNGQDALTDSLLQADLSTSAATSHASGAAPAGSLFDAAKVDGQALVRQVRNGIETGVHDGKTSVRLHLSPEDLGGIDLRVTAGPQGASVLIRAENPATGRLLEQNLGSLRAALQEAGVQLNGLAVGQQASQNGQSSSQQYPAQRMPATQAANSVEPGEANDTARPRTFRAQSQVNYLV